MYDFWFTLGASIMHPGYLEKAVKNAPPKFNHFIRVTTEIPLIGGHPCTVTNHVSAGLIEKCSAKKFRVALHAGLARLAKSGKLPTPPPISFYTVGRLSQILLTANLYFAGKDGNLAKAQQAYKKAGGHRLKEHSPSFPAFIGVCLIDFVLRNMHNATEPLQEVPTSGCPQPVDNCPDSSQSMRDDLKELLAEFRLSHDPNDPERKVITKFIDLSTEVMSRLLNADGDPWDYGCPEWIGYWSPQSDRVIT